MGAPQDGQAGASEETSFLHSGQTIKVITATPPRPGTSQANEIEFCTRTRVLTYMAWAGQALRPRIS